MPVPTQKDFYRPVLEAAAEAGTPLSRKEFDGAVAQRMNVSESDLQEVWGGGDYRPTNKFEYCVRAALRAHDAAGLLHQVSRGRYQITAAGRDFLAKNGEAISRRQLVQLAGQLQPGPDDQSSEDDYTADAIEEVAPLELISQSMQRLHNDLALDLLASIKAMEPYRFERLVVELLVKMDYGQGETVGRTGDGGIDGIINQDALGLEQVYIQAKRYTDSPVGSREIRDFSGSLDLHSASKGVFITTSTFSQTARETAQSISAGPKIVRLVDGAELARLMIGHGVGVVTERTYAIKKVDENYFADDA